MARTKEKEKAIALRKKGLSYSQIKEELGISKSTLSGWLHDMPLSSKQLKELVNTESHIEKIRETKRRKKIARLKEVYKKVSYDIEHSSNVDFISGFYLYWGEGTKTAEYTVSLTNTDPSIIRCFLDWLQLLDVSSHELRIKLHIYSDQNDSVLKKFWSRITDVPVSRFNKSYVKESFNDRKTYKGMFSYGTCVVAYHDRDTREYVLAGIDYLRDKYSIANM